MSASGLRISATDNNAINAVSDRSRIALYHAFNRFGPSRCASSTLAGGAASSSKSDTRGPDPRSEKWQAGRPRNFIHFMEEPPAARVSAERSCM